MARACAGLLRIAATMARAWVELERIAAAWRSAL